MGPWAGSLRQNQSVTDPSSCLLYLVEHLYQETSSRSLRLTLPPLSAVTSTALYTLNFSPLSSVYVGCNSFPFFVFFCLGNKSLLFQPLYLPSSGLCSRRWNFLISKPGLSAQDGLGRDGIPQPCWTCDPRWSITVAFYTPDMRISSEMGTRSQQGQGFSEVNMVSEISLLQNCKH